MSEDLRLFFALWPSEETRQRLLEVQRQLPKGAGRPTHAEDLHVTLVFLGQVEEQRLDCVRSVADGIRSEPFEMIIDRLEHWRRPRIRWCGPSSKPLALDRLVQDLEAGLQACHFEPEKRAYTPHVTLMRKAEPAPAEVLKKPIFWRADEFALVSTESPGVLPRYRVIHRWGMN